MGSRNFSRKKKQSQPPQNQIPHKFTADERVLCYEPDLKKARVLYDSKVLEVVERTDKGKIRAEYKIHFFGWNSSWDRYVTEECVLKDTDENRELQRELKIKADVLIQAHVKNKKRKKTLTEILKDATKDKTGKTTKPASGDTKNEDDVSNTSGSSDSSDQETSDDEDKTVSQIFLTDKVKSILEQDYFNILTRNMLVKIPAEVSVICVFEGYVKYLGFRELRKVIEQHKIAFSSSANQPSTSTSSSSANFASCSSTSKISSGTNKTNPNDFWMEDIARIYRKVRQSQEIVHGLKVIFDYMLYQMLLYDVENDQYKSHKAMRPRMPDINCSLLVPQLPTFGTATSAKDIVDMKKKQQRKGDQEVEVQTSTNKQYKSLPGASKDQSEAPNKSRKNVKSTTDSTCKERKSDRKSGDVSTIKPHSTGTCQLPKGLYDAALWIKAVNKYINELKSWQMLPEDCYKQEHPDPCMVYGLIHLLRFFVKLPEILNRMVIPNRKARIIAHHVNQMIDHIQTCHVFSISRLYVCLPRCVYEEDQICVTPSTSEDKYPKVNNEVDTDLSQYSTRNYRSIVLAKAKPQLAKVVEVPLSTTAGLEEHQLTIRNEASLPKSLELGNKDRKRTCASTNATTSSNSSTGVTVKIEHQREIKQEQLSPHVSHKPQIKKKSIAKGMSKPPVLPMIRQMRKSAAHAAFKTAHMFASQQNLTSRTIAASAVIKLEVEDEAPPSRKRSLPDDAPTSERKRVTRMSESRSSTCDASVSNAAVTSLSERRSRQDEPRSSVKAAERQTSKSTLEPRGSDSPSRQIKARRGSEKEDHSKNQIGRRGSTSRTSSSPVQKVKSTDSERKDDKSKTEPKKITSPRSSKSSGSSKEARFSKTKSTSPTSTIRLRSRSDERQLRSKGALIHALSLPMQSTPRPSHSSKSEGEKSPRRRESTGCARDSGANISLTKNNDQSHHLRGNRK